MLPADKASFPKCLYLDQNMWIALARSANGLDNRIFEDVIVSIRRAIALERLIVPLSAIHILETLAPRDLGRRRRLATVMVKLSRNYAMCPYTTVQQQEISFAVASTLGIFLPYAIRPSVVVQGLTQALGGNFEATGDPAQVAKFNKHLVSEKYSVDLLTNERFRKSLSYLRDRETLDATGQNERNAAALSNLSKQGLLQLDVRNLITNERVTNRISRTMHLLNVPVELDQSTSGIF